MRNSLEVAKYIEVLLEKNDMKPAELARRTGVDRSTISRYFKGERKIPMDEIPKFALALGVNPSELLLPKLYSHDSKSDFIINESNELYDFISLGLYGEVYCGDGEVHYGFPIDKIDTPKDWINGGDYFYLEAIGDSMIGAKVHEGDLLLIRKQEIVDNGEIAAVVVGDKRMLKRVYRTENKFTLVSDNPSYPPIEYNPDSDVNIRIIGKLKKSITTY